MHVSDLHLGLHRHYASSILKPETHRANCWPSEALGETQTTLGTNLLCSAALEAFGTAWTVSAPIQNAMSEKVGCCSAEPLAVCYQISFHVLEY